MKKQVLLVLFALSLTAPQARAQQPGSLDATFNGKGIKNVDFVTNTQTEEVTASILQPDGKLLVAYLSTDGENYSSYVSRFLTDGKEDVSFGNGGKKLIDIYFGGGYFIANAIALQNDGSIILAGLTRGGDGDYGCIIHLNSDGNIDTQFGLDGAASISGDHGEVFLTVQVHKTTGNIFASGGRPYLNEEDTNSSFFTTCFSSTGQIVSSFGGGTVYTSFYDAPFDVANSSVIKGNVLYVAGTVRDNSEPKRKHFGLLALNTTNGNLVRDFFYEQIEDWETYGMLRLPLASDAPGADNYCTAIKFSPDSTSLILGGYTFSPTVPTDVNFMLAKVSLKNGGYIDNTFSDDGVITYRMAGTVQNYLRTLEIEPDGKMMLGGTLTNGISVWTALRVLPNGTIDNNFGTAGRKVYDGFNGNSKINTFNLVGLHYNKSSQKYLFAGHYNNENPYGIDGLLKQINNNGSADNSYATNSEKRFFGAAEIAYLKDIAVRSDGKIMVAGRSGEEETGKDVLKRFQADGSDDQSPAIFLPTLVPSLSDMRIIDIEAVAGNKLLVAGHYNNAGNIDFFILRLKENGELDPDFSGDGFDTRSFSAANDFMQGIAVHSNGSIIMYGYTFQAINDYRIGVARYSSTGVFDTGFGSGGTFLYPAPYNSPDDAVKDVDVKIKSDGKIIVACTQLNTVTDRYDFTVFRLTAAGALDTGFGQSNSGIYRDVNNISENHILSSVFILSNDKILVAGATTQGTNRSYAMILLNADGAQLDGTFGNSGMMALDKGKQESITYVAVNDSKIIATGSYIADGKAYSTVMRFTLQGVLDASFAEKGHIQVGESLNKKSAIVNNKLYIVGADRRLDGASTYNALIYRFNLGTGPVIKTTNLSATSYNKFLGDAPFVIETTSNSLAAKSYTISSNPGGCVTVHPATGLVSMSCATVNTGSVTVRVIQPAVAGFTADTAFSTINVGKGIPKITFSPQGDTVGTSFRLKVQSNSDGSPDFLVSGGDTDSLYVYYDGETYTYGVGCVQVMVNYYETDNYLSAYAYTSVCAYEKLLAPAAFDDEVSLTYPVQGTFSFNPLANDEAYTGTLDPAGLDLDPSTPGIQHLYISPALGKFEADTIIGMVTYTAFEAFVGTGSISYVVYDSKNSASPAAKINVNVAQPAAELSPLKATELFTPNNDGLNDAFVIGNVIIGGENQLTIFDRNGQELFTENNYENNWRGELSNGKEAENGIYYYVFIERNGDKSRELKGVVELKR